MGCTKRIIASKLITSYILAGFDTQDIYREVLDELYNEHQDLIPEELESDIEEVLDVLNKSDVFSQTYTKVDNIIHNLVTQYIKEEN